MEATPQADNTPQQEEQQPQLDANKLNNYMEQLRLEQNLPMAIVAGLAAALVSAFIWAAITVATGYEIGYVAVAVGFIVGYAVRFAGKGMDQQFGVIGAVFAALGCALGKYFSVVAFIASEYGLGYFEVFDEIGFGAIPSIMAETFSVIDILFYGIALYEGYKFSFRKITEEDLMANAR